MLIICLLLSIIFFFLGRAYEFSANNKRQYPVHWLEYQTKCLQDAMNANKEKGRTLQPFFTNNEHKRIVVYGIGGIYFDFFSSDIDKQYFDEIYLADSNNAEYSKKLGKKIYAKEELLELLFDVIVVTSVSHFQEINNELKELGISKEIVSYSDLVFNASKED